MLVPQQTVLRITVGGIEIKAIRVRTVVDLVAGTVETAEMVGMAGTTGRAGREERKIIGGEVAAISNHSSMALTIGAVSRQGYGVDLSNKCSKVCMLLYRSSSILVLVKRLTVGRVRMVPMLQVLTTDHLLNY